MPARLGIDLGSSSIKLAKVNGKKVEVLGMISNPVGKVMVETEKERDALAEVIKRMVVEHKISERRFKIVVPESVVYSRVINLPVLSDAELSSAIRWEAEQYIPVPLDEVELSWEVVDRPVKRTGGEKMRVYLAAADKKLVNGLMEVFAEIGLEPERIEPELVTTSRVIALERKLTGATMVAIMGATGMGIGVFENDQLLFVYKFGSGGVALTRSITASLQLTLQQAEEYKRTYGVQSNVLEGKLLLAMKPVLDGVIGEMKRAVSYYTQSFPGGQMARVIIAGGVALTPGLVQWMTAQLGVEVAIGNPFEGLEVTGDQSKLGAVYAPVIGATARG